MGKILLLAAAILFSWPRRDRLNAGVQLDDLEIVLPCRGPLSDGYDLSFKQH